jgi:hypothetical protein
VSNGLVAEWLECQQCGSRLRLLSDVEAQRVARNPELFIVFCADCRKDQPEGIFG